jgi:hypothetical protein
MAQEAREKKRALAAVDAEGVGAGGRVALAPPEFLPFFVEPGRKGKAKAAGSGGDGAGAGTGAPAGPVPAVKKQRREVVF